MLHPLLRFSGSQPGAAKVAFGKTFRDVRWCHGVRLLTACAQEEEKQQDESFPWLKDDHKSETPYRLQRNEEMYTPENMRCARVFACQLISPD